MANISSRWPTSRGNRWQRSSNREVPFRRRDRSRSCCGWRSRWPKPTAAASSTVTSNRLMSWSTSVASRSSWILGCAPRLDSEASDLTRSGTLLGTPHYMAPEQVDGLRELIGPACDVYSLGVILYELLAGQRPFRGTYTRVLGLILTQEPALLGAIRPEIDRDLELICQKAMAKNIEERYASMQALAEDLETWLAKRPVESGSQSAGRVIQTEATEGEQYSPLWPSTFSPGEPRNAKRSNGPRTIGRGRWLTAPCGGGAGPACASGLERHRTACVVEG